MKLFFKFNLSMLLVLNVLFLSSCKKKVEKETLASTISSEYDKTDKKDLCTNDWFPHAQIKNPLEGKNSPFAKSSSTNAIFHQWSWQKFLWLTKPSYGVERLPLFLNPDKMIQVNPHMSLVPPQEGARVVLKAKKQAGSDGVLETNPGYSRIKKSYDVYYSIHIDPIFKKAAEKFKDSILNGTLGKNNLSSFPVGSLDIKVSWVDKNAISEDKLKNYFTTVAALSMNDGGTYKNIEVALLGMHVVGVVENHPEFIWATFEHDDMAPNYNWKERKASSLTEKLLFKKGETKTINGITWSKDKMKKAESAAKEKHRAFDLFEYGVPRDSLGKFMNTGQDEPINFNNIKNINACVKENLQDVWRNYFYNGSIWIDTDDLNKTQQAKLLVGLRGGLSSGNPQTFARGSLNCANVTMETYTQTFQNTVSKINVGKLANCFSCHNAVNFTTQETSPIYMSHMFDAYINREKGKTFEEVEKLKLEQERKEFKVLSLN